MRRRSRRPRDGGMPLDYLPPHLVDPEEGGRRERESVATWFSRLPAWVLILSFFALVAGYQLYRSSSSSGVEVAAGAARGFSPPPAEAAPGRATPLPREAGETEPAEPEGQGALPAEPAAPALIQPMGAAVTSAPAGSSVSLSARVVDRHGVPVPGVPVEFRLEEGTGALDPAVGRTGPAGVARTSLILPPRPAMVVVSAAAVGADLAPVVFTVEAEAGAPAHMVPIQGDYQEVEPGTQLPVSPALRVSDQLDNPVVGLEVVFEVTIGGGSVAPARTQTDSRGIAATTWRLGDTPGTQRLSARAPATGASVIFTAMAETPEPPSPEPPPPQPASAPPPGAGRPVRVLVDALAVGGTHVCSLSGGSLRCRGANDRGQGGAEGEGRLAVAAGVSHACALAASGVATCWGANESGQLGDGSRTDRESPVFVDTAFRFSTLTAGAAHTCGLAADGVPVCWGRNLNGQLGDGSRNDRGTPWRLSNIRSLRSIVAGWDHTCGITANGDAYCWGLNSDGQLGDGTRLDRLTPTRVASSVRLLVAGSAHTCALTTVGRVLCWGDNSFGQLGDGTTEPRTEPTAVIDLPSPPVSLAAGAVHTCALLADGTALCWGQNLHGQLGDGSTENRSRPTPVVGGLSFSALEAGGGVTCGVTSGDVQYCWGLNQSGQLGDGSRTNRSAPVRVRR